MLGCSGKVLVVSIEYDEAKWGLEKKLGRGREGLVRI